MENVGTMLRPIAFQVKPAQIGYTRRGDVAILKVPTGHAIVVGSTSSGALGPKRLDRVRGGGRVLGRVLTGGGVWVVGFANEEDLRLGKTRPGDLLVAVGKPKVGDEVIRAKVKGEIADLRNVIWLSQKKY